VKHKNTHYYTNLKRQRGIKLFIQVTSTVRKGKYMPSFSQKKLMRLAVAKISLGPKI